ncbi:MAG: thioredoxin family protein [Acidimicrobiia bacterium]|nr:thioredoxin family protein [Acidimicrobiia bacterium]
MPLFKKRPKPISLESYQQLQELVDSGKPVLVDFFQHGCGPCQVMDGIVNELAEEFSESAIVVKANVRNVPEALDTFKVRSTPTFVLLTKKPEATKPTQRWRASGLVKKDVLTKSLISAGASPSDG